MLLFNHIPISWGIKYSANSFQEFISVLRIYTGFVYHSHNATLFYSCGIISLDVVKNTCTMLIKFLLQNTSIVV